MPTLVFLFLSGALAGAMNAVAGGGSFVTFPAMVLAGLPPVAANASSTVALFPGGLASLWAFRSDIQPRFAGVRLSVLIAASAIGGAIGAWLLLATSQRTFDAVIPWVLLLATLTFAFGRALGQRLGGRLQAGPAGLVMLQVVLSIYGGYFGGAVGIMMMAGWMVATTADVKLMNPHRALLVNAANAVAVVCFVVAGTASWPAALAALCGAVGGGYAGARLARRLPASAIRAVVIVLGATVTALFFLRVL